MWTSQGRFPWRSFSLLLFYLDVKWEEAWIRKDFLEVVTHELCQPLVNVSEKMANLLVWGSCEFICLSVAAFSLSPGLGYTQAPSCATEQGVHTRSQAAIPNPTSLPAFLPSDVRWVSRHHSEVPLPGPGDLGWAVDKGEGCAFFLSRLSAAPQPLAANGLDLPLAAL